MDILCRHFCMTGMRCQKYIVKSPYQRDLPVHDLMRKQSKNFMIHHLFFQSIVIVQTCLGSPAKIYGRGDILFCPLHDLFHFFPVIYFLKFHLLHRSSGDDHSIVLLLFHFIKSLIELIQMAGGCIFGSVAFYHHKRNIHLERGIGKRTEELQLRLLF